MKKLNCLSENPLPLDGGVDPAAVLLGVGRRACWGPVWGWGCLAALALALQAGAAWAGSPGSRTGEVLKFESGAKGFALAEAQTASADDAFSLHANPAGLAGLELSELGLAYNAWIEGVRHQALVYAHPTRKRGTFALGATRLSVGGIQGYDAGGSAVESFSAQDLVLTLGYGRSWPAFEVSRLQAGVNAKWLKSELEKAQASGYAYGAGLQLRGPIGKGELAAGVALLNNGPGLRYDREKDPLAGSLKFGLSASRRFFGDPFTLSLDVQDPADDRLHWLLGAEAWIKNLIALRAGYRSRRDLGSAFHLGLGLKVKMFRLDYAFRLLGDFGASHRAGLTLRWGEPLEVSRDLDWERKARKLKGRGKEHMLRGRYLDAVRVLNEALEFDPGDKEIIRLMREAYGKLEKSK